MTKIPLIFFLIFFFTIPLFAQSVDTAWVRRYNGPGNSWDGAYAIAVDGSGNVYVTGGSYGSGTYSDYATIKYDPDGNQLWEKRYNGPGDWDDEARAIAVDGSGNVYVTGESYDSETSYDYATIKYSANGDTAWVRRYNGPPGNWSDEARAIALDGSGNVYVTGYSYGSGTEWDYATIKYDPDGNELWVKRYNGPENYYDEALAIAVDGSGNVYVTGYSYGSGTSYDYATIKYGPDGNQLWEKRYNGPGNSSDYASAIAVDGSGNVYVTGRSAGSGTDWDYATIKYDPDGNELWVQRYNGPSKFDDIAYAIALDGSGNVYVTGMAWISAQNQDYATIKYDQEGNELWVRRYNGPGNSGDWAYAIALDSSGNIYVTGYSWGSGASADYATIKYDQEGNELWVRRYNGPGNSWDGASAIAVDGSGNVYVTGRSYGSGTYDDYATIKYWQDYPPDSFSIISPTDSAIVPCEVDSDFVLTFEWQMATDPDPWDTVRYDLYLSNSPSFHPDSTIIVDSLIITQYSDTLDIGRYYWKIKAYDDHTEIWSTQTWTFLSAILGDANADMELRVADVIYVINYLFKGGQAPFPELAVADANGDGQVNVSDVIYLINYLFKGGPPPVC